MKCIFKADDYGFTQGINLGILKAHKEGLVTSTGIMINMPYAHQAIELIQAYPCLCLGLHVNIVIGKPVSPANQVSCLVDEQGHFHSSTLSREKIAAGIDPVANFAEGYREVEAQILQFYRLSGKMPEYLEGHAIRSKNLQVAMAQLAKKYNLVHLSYLEGMNHRITQQVQRATSVYDFYPQGIHPQQYFTDNLCDLLDKEVAMVTMHPGYLDKDIYDYSSFTKVRVLDLEALTHPDTLAWIQKHNIQPISFRDITLLD